jgi:hypothetical protein
MRELKAISFQPLVRPDGSLCLTPGYDDETQVYCHFDGDDFEGIPVTPTREDLTAAMRDLFAPWRGYTFASNDDRAAMVAAVMTAICRPALDTAPGFFSDAPVQASGKTKLAQALGSFMLGKRAGITSFVSGANSEAETAKEIISLLLAGEGFWLIDNIKGTWCSAVIAGLMTSGGFNGRVLGASQWFNGDARLLVCATGNNAALDHDLGRRFIKIRIDAGVEKPQTRIFDFDPVAEALGRRVLIARGALTLFRGWCAAGKPSPRRVGCDFAEWDRLVRCCVLWIAEQEFAVEAGIGELGDPARSITEDAGRDDPETEGLRTLLMGLAEKFETTPFTAKTVHLLWQAQSGDVFDGLAEITGGRRDLTPKSIGRVMVNRRDRVCGGLALRRVGEDRNGAAVWCVVRA